MVPFTQFFLSPCIKNKKCFTFKVVAFKLNSGTILISRSIKLLKIKKNLFFLDIFFSTTVIEKNYMLHKKKQEVKQIWRKINQLI